MANKETNDRPLLIGWKEDVALPDWRVRRLRAKIDTGARTSALDVVRYQLQETAAGLMAELHLALHQRNPQRRKVVVVPVLKMVTVKNSTGHKEWRPVVETTLCLGPVRKLIRLTITRRPGLRHRLILGRQALAEDFVVDVSRKFLLRSP